MMQFGQSTSCKMARWRTPGGGAVRALLLLNMLSSGCGRMMMAAVSSDGYQRMEQSKSNYRRAAPDANFELIIWSNASLGGDAFFVDGRRLKDIAKEYVVMDAGMDIEASVRYLANLSTGPHFVTLRQYNKETTSRVVVGSGNFQMVFGSRSGMLADSAAQAMASSARDARNDYGGSPYFAGSDMEKAVLAMEAASAAIDGSSGDSRASLNGCLRAIASTYPDRLPAGAISKMDAVWDVFESATRGEINLATASVLTRALERLSGHDTEAERVGVFLELLVKLRRDGVSPSGIKEYWSALKLISEGRISARSWASLGAAVNQYMHGARTLASLMKVMRRAQ